MKTTVKRTVKAVTPYGAIVVYRRLKPRVASKKSETAKKRKLQKDFDKLYKTAKTIKESSKKPQIVVSLTTYGKRTNAYAPIAVASILNQSVLPDKLILWLADGEKVSQSIKKLVKKGLDVRFTEDTLSYKKLIPTLELFPDSMIITADDDIVYPKDWLKKLITAHRKEPKKIIAHRAHEMKLDENGLLLPYAEWGHNSKVIDDAKYTFPTGCAGILYPPHSLSEKVLDKVSFRKLAPNADDVWFWAMAKLKGTKHMLLKGGYSSIGADYLVDPSDRDGLYWTINSDGGNDKQLSNIINEFPKIAKDLKICMSQDGSRHQNGLRFNPSKKQGIEEEILFSKHQFAYDLAEKQIKDSNGKIKKVLDYGTGDGYGADFLAKNCPNVEIFATDIDEESLEMARQKYKRKNLHFVKMDNLPKIDLIVSFQVIEHVDNVEEYLRFLKSLLNKNGKIIISTPDRRYRLTRSQRPWNQYHLREYDKSDLETDAKRVFPEAQVYQLSGDKNMLRIEYARVVNNRDDRAIYGGQLPDSSTRKYTSKDFFLSKKDTKDSVDLFVLIGGANKKHG